MGIAPSSGGLLVLATSTVLLTAACAPAQTATTSVSSSPVESASTEEGDEAATVAAGTSAGGSDIDIPSTVDDELATACDDRLGFCASYPEDWLFRIWEDQETLGSVAITSGPMDSPVGMGDGMWIDIKAEAAVADQSFDAWTAQATDGIGGVEGVELGKPRPINVGGRPAVLRVVDAMGAIDTHTFYGETAYIDDGELRWRIQAMTNTPEHFERHRHGLEAVLGSVAFGPRGVEAAHVNGRYFRFVREIEAVGTGDLVLEVDIAHMLGGDEAGRAAVEDGVIDAPDELPNGFYIRNLDATTVRFQLPTTATIELLVPDGSPMLRSTTVSALLRLYSEPVPEEQRWMRNAPYWITVEGRVVRRLMMQYLP